MDDLCEPCKALDLTTVKISDSRIVGSRQTFLGTVQQVLQRRDLCKFCAFICRNLQVDAGGQFELEDASPHPVMIDFAQLQTATLLLTSQSKWLGFMRRVGYSLDYIEEITDNEPRFRRANLAFPGRNVLEHNVSVQLQPGKRWPSSRLFSFSKVYDPSLPRREQQLFERRLKGSSPDFMLLRSWIETCATQHRELCDVRHVFGGDEAKLMRVIDTEKRCVIAAPAQCQYAALSYVWGQSQFVASETDLAALPWHLPGHSRVSQAINDAMEICQKINVRYLWVDALCIVQMPEMNSDKAHQISQMDRIYQGAFVTICAASSSSAADGIQGLKRSSDSTQQGVFEFKGAQYAKFMPKLEDYGDVQEWNWRAWTFQERLLSSRVLVFTDSEVFWLCQCEAWAESTIAEPIDDDAVGLLQWPRNDTSGLLENADWAPPEWQYDLKKTLSLPGTGGFSDLKDQMRQVYQQLVTQYTTRKLGDPRDGLNAINGVFNALQQRPAWREDQFFWGLPVSFFDDALLWKSLSGARRSELVRKNNLIPSWSWAAWFSSSSFGVQWDGLAMGETLLPAIDWMIVGRNGIPYRIYAAGSDDKAKELPSGLPPELVNEEPPRLFGNLLYPENFCLQFQTTVTTSFKIGPALTFEPEWDPTPSLRGKAQQYVSNIVPTAPYELLDASGNCVGHIVLSDLDLPPLSGRTLSLIFLSYAPQFDIAIVKSARLEACAQAVSRPRERRVFITNCMLVQETSYPGVYERQALAKVSTAAWLTADPKPRWIVLA